MKPYESSYHNIIVQRTFITWLEIKNNYFIERPQEYEMKESTKRRKFLDFCDLY